MIEILTLLHDEGDKLIHSTNPTQFLSIIGNYNTFHLYQSFDYTAWIFFLKFLHGNILDFFKIKIILLNLV